MHQTMHDHNISDQHQELADLKSSLARLETEQKAANYNTIRAHQQHILELQSGMPKLQTNHDELLKTYNALRSSQDGTLQAHQQHVNDLKSSHAEEVRLLKAQIVGMVAATATGGQHGG